MMQRSYRSLVTNISRGFLKKNKRDKNVTSSNNQTQESKQETQNVDSQMIQQSKQSTNQRNNNRSAQSNKNKKWQKNRDYQQKQTQQSKQVLGEKRKYHWQQRKEKLEVNENSAHQRKRPRHEEKHEIKQEQVNLVLSEKNAQRISQLKKQLDNFHILIKENKIQGQLNSHLQNINQQSHSEDLFNLIVLYLQTNVHQASTYYTNNVLKAQITNKQVRLKMNKIEQKIIIAYLLNQDLEGLYKFSTVLKEDYSKKGKKIEYETDNAIQILQTLAESRECPQKYRILTNIIGVIKMNQQQKIILARYRLLMRFYMQNFVKKYKGRESRDQKLQSAFEQSLAAMEKGNLFQPTFFTSDSVIEYLEIVYFNQCSKPEKLKCFVDLISKIKFSSDGPAKLEKFFYKWYNALINFTINSTDCQAHPFLINSQLIKNYEGLFKEKKIEGVLVIVAICLSNKYLSIPLHFLENYKNIDWKIQIKKDIIKMIESEVDVLSLQQNKQQKQRAQKSKNTFDRIRMYIILKDYEKAMQIYNQFYFKKECVKKQRQIIKEVYTKKAISQLSAQKANLFFTDLNHFVDNLSEEYLWESWKKSEDLGYMMEDYYIKQEDPKESQAKMQKRFSFWDKYFQTKRVNEINRFQKLNQLKNLRQPNKEPLIQGQFNLNNFLSKQNYQKYKQEAKANEKKDREFQLFLYQAEEATLSEDAQSKGPGLLSLQSTMCEQNLKILEEFGLKDYDLSVHDKEQFKIRFNNLKKHRGVMRAPGTLKLINQMKEKMNQVFQVEQKQKFVDEKKKEKVPRKKKVVKVISQGEDAQLMEEVGVTEQVVEEKGQEQEIGQIQQISQDKEEKQQQQIAQQKGQLQVVEEKVVREPKKQRDIFCKQFADQLRMKKRAQFRKAAINIRIEAHPMVNQLISWGVLNKKPMAIYMGQKLAMITGQIIPHNLAIRVSDLLSHSRSIQKQLIADCKVCLSHIGQINREFIYLSNYKYHHIAFRPYFSELVLNMNKPIRERLIDIVGQNPNLMDTNTEPREEWKRALKNSNSIF